MSIRMLACIFAAAVSVVMLSGAAWAAPEPLNIYVSPDGSDMFSGGMARNAPQHNDGPVATVFKACEIVRHLRQGNNGKLDRPVNIILRGGTYWLSQPLELTAQDSGTAEFPVTFSAFQSEKPVLSAGRPIRGWGKETFNGRDVWAAKVPQLQGADDAFREMWVNGQRRLLARSPNKGFFIAGEVPDLNKKTPLPEGQTRFHFNEGDLKNWPDAPAADLVLMSLWAESHLSVTSIDEKEHMVHFKQPTVHKMAPGDLYYIEGAAELLDDPGEWYFDRKTATLYYLPMPGEGMIDSEVVIPWHEQVVRLRGTPEKGQFVEHVSFRGITFANSAWDLPRSASPIPGMKPGGFNQAAWGVPGSVWGEGVHDCVFSDCTFTRAGNYGLELGRGCERNKISYCTFSDLGAGGIKLGQTKVPRNEADQTKQNEISDCTVADCGRTFPSAIGIWLGETPQNLLSHNDIHGLWYTGISIGWTWGYGDSAAGDNVVEFNHVHHIGTPADGVGPILSDMGAIYTLGKQPGTIIRNNCFHDIAALRYGGWGIYFDEGSTGILAENNLVYRTKHAGFHQHYGENNIVRNNIFALGQETQIRRTRVEDHLSFTFENNIVYWDTGTLLDGNWAKLNVAFDHNTYWHVGGEDFKFGKMTWDEWRKAGMDVHSQIRDPGFIDPAKADFRLKPGSEKDLPDFTPFDVSTAGPRPRQSQPR